MSFTKKDLWPFGRKPKTLPTDNALSWRQLDADDLDALCDLYATVETHDDPPYRTSKEEIEVLFVPQFVSRSVGGFDESGALRAFAHVRLRLEDQSTAVCSGGVDPQWRGRGIGRRIVAWQESNARQMLAEAGPGKSVIISHVEPQMLDYQNLLADYGFTWTQTYYEMRRDLSEFKTDVKPPAFIKLITWDSDLADNAFQLTNAVLEASGSTTTLTMNEWLAKRQHHFKEASVMAIDHRSDRPKVVGVLLCSAYPQDWPILGWKEGYIDLLVVSPDYDSKAVGAAMMCQSARVLRQEGFEKVAVGVEVVDSQRLLRLYESLGFQTTNVSKVMSIQVE